MNLHRSMEFSLLVAAFILGLSASPNCLAVCMPVMVPVITTDPKSSPKLGLYFSIYLSAGRLLIYLILAAFTGYIGSTLLNEENIFDEPGREVAARILMGIIAVVVILYAILLRKGWLPPVTCPKMLLPTITKKGPLMQTELPSNPRNDSKSDSNLSKGKERITESGMIPFIFGLLFASIICPPFIILLGTTLVSSGPGSSLVAGFLFWAGTLPLNLTAGTISGSFAERWRKKTDPKTPSFVTDVSTMTLVMVGFWWLFLAFT